MILWGESRAEVFALVEEGALVCTYIYISIHCGCFSGHNGTDREGRTWPRPGPQKGWGCLGEFMGRLQDRLCMVFGKVFMEQEP